MSSTPKKARRNGGNCVCTVQPEWSAELAGTCRYGYCTEFRCPRCRGMLGGWGAMSCKCTGAPRWLRHPAMGERGHWDFKADKWVCHSAAVKPSLPKFKRDRAGFR